MTRENIDGRTRLDRGHVLFNSASIFGSAIVSSSVSTTTATGRSFSTATATGSSLIGLAHREVGARAALPVLLVRKQHAANRATRTNAWRTVKRVNSELM